MRILITADLHYDIPRSQEPVRRLAREVCNSAADAIVLVGDTAGADLDTFAQCLRLFKPFSGMKLIVPGNHCLWSSHGESSLDRYEHILPELAWSEGFLYLDHKPVIIGQVGLVGSIGWYDYSFHDRSLGIPEAFYEAKVAPGAASYFHEHEQYQKLMEEYGRQLTPRQLGMFTRWMDGKYVKLPMSDREFLQMLTGRLRNQLADVSTRAERIIAFLHHLPFRKLVPQGRPDKFAFAAAYMGSQLLGDALMDCPKVTNVYCGHSHWPGRHKIGHLTVVNIGSTYIEKVLEVLDIE